MCTTAACSGAHPVHHLPLAAAPPSVLLPRPMPQDSAHQLSAVQCCPALQAPLSREHSAAQSSSEPRPEVFVQLQLQENGLQLARVDSSADSGADTNTPAPAPLLCVTTCSKGNFHGAVSRPVLATAQGHIWPCGCHHTESWQMQQPLLQPLAQPPYSQGGLFTQRATLLPQHVAGNAYQDALPTLVHQRLLPAALASARLDAQTAQTATAWLLLRRHASCPGHQ
jgi:hypothetical protein